MKLNRLGGAEGRRVDGKGLQASTTAVLFKRLRECGGVRTKLLREGQ